jgi:signal transduction histidine kinase
MHPLTAAAGQQQDGEPHLPADPPTRAVEWLARLQALTAAFSRAVTSEQVADVLMTEGLATLGATGGVLVVLNADRTEFACLRIAGYPPKVADAWCRFPADAHVPLADAVRDNVPVVLESFEERQCRYPEVANRDTPGTGGALVAIPIRRGDLVGGFGFSFPTARGFGEGDRGFLVTIGALCAQALERARLYEAAQAACRRAELEVEERKHLVEELRRRGEQLAEANRRKDDFLAILGHELRGPLAPVRNAIQVLKLSGAPDSNLRWASDVIERQVQHLSRLVDDLLDVSRITRGKVQLRDDEVALAAVVNRAVETSRPLIEERKHALTVSLSPEPLRLRGDAVRLTQVLSNLLSNAAKYTEEGGRIDLTVRREGDEAVVRVQDTGVGIPAEMLPRVFDLFTQVDGSAQRALGGLGVGLTLVRSLVEMHGGVVEAFSDGPGRGSTFVVRLPALPNQQQAAAEEAPAPAAPAGGVPPRRVLVVDDNRDAAESLAVLARLWGHEVRVAHDGPSALAAAAEQRPHVILLDLGLPGLSGVEVARRLREDPAFADTLLVALTGYGGEEDRRRSRDAGLHLHWVKPVDPAALQALLASPEVLRRTAQSIP